MSTEHMEELNDQQIVRREKMAALREQGIDPFGKRFERTANSQELKDKFAELDKEQLHELNETAAIAGRLVTKRGKGKVGFAHLQDREGQIQIYVRKDEVGEENYEIFKKADLGDFLGVEGEVMRTDMGELSIKATHITHLSKALRPLPEKFHGIESDEERYRKRYLDMATDDELRAMFVRKSKFWDATREYLKQHGFLEVETPTLEHTTGGAEARPFATHHNDYDVDVFLRISIGELWQKRLMAGGFPKTFEIGRAYRNEGSSPDHLQEFTNLEFYWAYADYEDGMSFVQGLYQHIAKSVYGTTKFSHKGLEFDLAGEWPRIDYLTAVEERTGINLLTATDDEMRQKLEELGVKYEGTNRERLTDTLWKYVRKQIAGPAFLVNHPELISPLAKVSEKFPGKVERFQPIIAGSEVGNGYSELNDPIDQRERFEKQQEMLESGDDEAMMPDWEFIEMLEHGMPPTCGFGFGERLFAFLEGKPIREVQYFPFMKQVQSEKKSDEK